MNIVFKFLFILKSIIVNYYNYKEQTNKRILSKYPSIVPSGKSLLKVSCKTFQKKFYAYISSFFHITLIHAHYLLSTILTFKMF